jgi:V8-like Glu-specific endopeptidase
MRRILIVIFLIPFTISLMAQKVWVGITKTKDAAESVWQVLDEQFNPVFSSTEYPKDDSIPFSLEANKRYLFEVSITRVNKPDTILCRLYINSEPVLLVKTGVGPGDHFYYFFTGVRQPVTKITGGSDATISDFPWQVYLEAGNFSCGGSIIANDWVITAAHCTEDDLGNLIGAADMSVTVGANDPAAGGGKKYSVSQVIRNENYNSTTLENDLALIKLSQPINYTNATPIRLISRNDSAAGLTDPGVMSWVTGYGLTRVRPPSYPATLQKVQLPIVSNTQAAVVWSDIPLTDLMAGFLNGGKDACSGDSGGPLVVPVDSQYKLAGIVSWGSSNCTTYGAYTRVSTFESWISRKTGIEISFTPPVPSGDSIICPGIQSSNYTVGTVQGAASYEWAIQPSGAGTITGSSGDATVNWNQSYKGAAVIMLRVVRNNLPSDWSERFVHLANQTRLISQSEDTVICADQSIVLGVASEGYNLIYSWYKNDTLLKKGASNLVNFNGAEVSNSGIYRCNVSGSCGSDNSDPLTLTVYPLTAINNITPDSELAFGGSVDLSVSAVGHDLKYQWMVDSTGITNATISVLSLVHVNAGNSGLYSVRVDGTCGIVTSRNVYVYVKTQNFNNDPEVFVWPTHTNSSINIALSEAGIYDIRVFGASGSLVMERNECQYLTALDFSGLARGLYIISVYNNNFRKSFKVIRN